LPFIVIFCLPLLCAGPAGPAFAGREIPVLVDGLPVSFDVKPVLQNGRTLVPFRAIAEALNVAVAWDGATRTVTASGGQTTVRLQIGNSTAYHNDAPVVLDVPPVIAGGRTLIPVRFFSEAFGCKVDWDAAARAVKITSPPRPMTVMGFYALGDSATSSWTDLFQKPYPAAGPGNTDVVGELALGWYSLDEKGRLLTRSRTGWQRPDGWEKVLEAARSYNLRTEMVVHLTDQDGAIVNLLSDAGAVSRAVKEIAAEAGRYHGVNLDFEGLGYRENGEQLAATRAAFTAFASRLAEKLHAAGLGLTLTLHAPNSVYRGYDYRALGEAADRIVIMAYDYGSKPEPLNLVLQAVQEAATAVPPAKLLLGISVPSETPESIITKVGVAKRYHLGGIALWRLGLVPGDMWQALRTTVRPRVAGDKKFP